jgi:5-methylthioadenosine/S-adenosylhomocysteine deaminase
MIAGGTILVMDDNDHKIRNGAVAIEGEKIIAVGEKEDIENRYAASEIIDATDSLIMPGLVNCHNHAPMTYFRGLADDLELMD